MAAAPEAKKIRSAIPTSEVNKWLLLRVLLMAAAPEAKKTRHGCVL